MWQWKAGQQQCTRCKWDEPAIAMGLPAKPDPAKRQPGQNMSERGHGIASAVKPASEKSHLWPCFSSTQELISARLGGSRDHHLHARPSLGVIPMPKKQWEMLTSLAQVINFPVLKSPVEYCRKVSFALITTPQYRKLFCFLKIFPDS